MPPLSQFRRFDARPLIEQGIEPFPEIRKRLDALKVGQGLILMAPFLPSPLVERLRAEGWESRLERGTDGEWIVYFWRPEPATIGE